MNSSVRAGSVSDGPASSLTLPTRTAPLYPFTSRFLNVAGFRLHYLDEGAGEPVVMLHGNPTWWQMTLSTMSAAQPSRPRKPL